MSGRLGGNNYVSVETAFLAMKRAAEDGREGEIPARHDAIGTYEAWSLHGAAAGAPCRQVTETARRLLSLCLLMETGSLRTPMPYP